MKKVTLFAFLAFTFASTLNSCSKDEQTPVPVVTETPTSNLILPKKIVLSGGSDGTTTITLTYKGNKIVEINYSEGTKEIYTYTGDLITKTETYEGKTLTDQSIYNYTNNKLTNVTTTENSIDNSTGMVKIYKSKDVYIYNTDETILNERYTIDNVTGAETKDSNSDLKTFANGNLVKEVSSSSYTYFNGIENVTSATIRTTTYEYDTKNNPIKNILGFNKLLFSGSNTNNTIKKTTISKTTTNGVDEPSSPADVSDYEFRYNENGYPKEEKNSYVVFDNNQAIVKTRTTQYFYE